jgi:hypothetical protein
MISRQPYQMFPPEIGRVGCGSIGGERFRRYAADFIRNISYQIKPYGVPFKYWEILHYGRYTKYGYRLGKPSTLKFRFKGRHKKTDSIEVIRQKKRIWTRTEFDWHLASALVSAGWSMYQFRKLYENFASSLNIFQCLGGSPHAGSNYLMGKYQRAIHKLQQAPDPKRVGLGKFLRILLEKRSEIDLKNGQISTLLGILYARQRISGPTITLSMRELSLNTNVDLSTISRSVQKLLGQWLFITNKANLARGNTYEIMDATIHKLYDDCFGEESIPEMYLTANCTVPLSDSVFVRNGIGLDGYLIAMKLGMSGGPLEFSFLRQCLNIEARKLTCLLARMAVAGLILYDGVLVCQPNSTDLKKSGIFLGVAQFKAHLNQKYSYEHKLHRFKLFAWGLRNEDFKQSKQYAITSHQRELQQRFQKVFLKKRSHPGVTIGAQMQRLFVDKDPRYRDLLQSKNSSLLRSCVQYVWRTGSYIVHGDHRPRVDREIFQGLLDGACQHRVDFQIVEEIESNDT